MSKTRDLLLEAAEGIVRTRGLAALTVRSLAAETNYGKSTVHEAVGGVEALQTALRDRARQELVAVAADDAPIEPADPEWRARLFRRLSRWVIENPHWAEACFLPQPTRNPAPWTHPVSEILMGALPAGLEHLTHEDGVEFGALSARVVGATIPTLIHVGDETFGAATLELAYDGLLNALVELIELRARVVGEIDLRVASTEEEPGRVSR